MIFVDPGEPIDDFKIQVDIQESRDITQLKVQPMSYAIESIVDGSGNIKIQMIIMYIMGKYKMYLC